MTAACVTGTSFHYFKRFYLNNSVMDYHPKHMLVTCVYLACKVEEFNVSIAQFVNNVRGDREKATDIILNNELLLMQQLEYHLTIHNPYRPLEGLLIDIKTRCPQFPDPEKLRSLMDDFLERTLFTDAVLLMAPSQANQRTSATLLAGDQWRYVTDILFAGCSHDKLHHIKDAVKKLHLMVKAIQVPPKDRVRAAEQKLEKCRNQENNPDSQM
ncbi:Cdk activating kinase, putative [Ixodes scapularis]|uniref:Cdk activating kinase, putative n=1 Tax=Ixodes scapularis TaxID=6945 RepID=B7PB82_IXOSC|nr:Cdk activating kinase, putative [Ixodes scapularis]|eukprot:XP_002407738.1 Cdk activating kinase, putative [Ixodes scapularis]